MSNAKHTAGSNFYYSFLFLPQPQKEAIINIYAFCREVDDIVDECSDSSIAEQKLIWWSSEIDQVFNGTPQHPISKKLASTVHKFGLQRVWFDEILQGMAMDLRYHGYDTWEDLKVYCHCVASTVGMLAATVFGYKNPNTLEYAKQLGIAFQLINIIRDVGEDARRGRIYIPETYLIEFGILPEELLGLKIQDNKKFSAMLSKMAKLAREYHSKAIDALPLEDRATQLSGLIMAHIYFNILKEIENINFDVLNQKITLTPLRKLWIAWNCWRTEKKIYQQL
jgi:15-cis-phytoene synthase